MMQSRDMTRAMMATAASSLFVPGSLLPERVPQFREGVAEAHARSKRERMMNLHRIAGAALLLAGALLASGAQALDLNGVWASDPALCDKIFTKKGKQVAFSPLSDLYGSGFIIEGSRIRGKIARCTIKSRKEEGSTIQLSATCSTTIAAEQMDFSLKVIDDNTVGRVYPGISAMQVNFHRCRP
jgi:hypothetical protein